MEGQEKPYECEKQGCGKRFATLQRLKHHGKTHEKLCMFSASVFLLGLMLPGVV